MKEMDQVRETGVDVSRLVVSGNAHMIMPYHLEIARGPCGTVNTYRSRYFAASRARM